MTAFVPMGAVFPALAPKEQGAAISVNNLASDFLILIGKPLTTINVFFLILGTNILTSRIPFISLQ